MEARSENMSKRSEYKKMMLRLARIYADKGDTFSEKRYMESHRTAEKAPYGFFPNEKYEGDFSFVRKISLEDVRIILSTLAGKSVIKVNHWEPRFPGISKFQTTIYEGSIKKENDGTFSFKAEEGTYKNIDKEIADLQIYDGIGRPLKAKIHHVEIKTSFIKREKK